MQNTPDNSMLTSTKVALSILLIGLVISCFVAVVWENQYGSARQDLDTIAADTAFMDWDDYEIDTVSAPTFELAEESIVEEPAVEALATDLSLDGYISNGGNRYPIEMYITLHHSRDEISGAYMWRASGKYAYKTTLDQYGRGPASWFTFTGHGPGNSDDEPTELTLQVRHPDGSDFEQWTLTPSTGGFDGSILNLNTFEIFSVTLMEK